MVTEQLYETRSHQAMARAFTQCISNHITLVARAHECLLEQADKRRTKQFIVSTLNAACDYVYDAYAGQQLSNTVARRAINLSLLPVWIVALVKDESLQKELADEFQSKE